MPFVFQMENKKKSVSVWFFLQLSIVIKGKLMFLYNLNGKLLNNQMKYVRYGSGVSFFGELSTSDSSGE